MGYLDSLNITGSALTAERFRTDIILQNLANQNTTRTAEGGPYRRKQVVLRENQLDFKSELGKAMTKADRGGVYVEEVVAVSYTHLTQKNLEAVSVETEAVNNKSYETAWMVTLQLGSSIIPPSIFDFMK